MDPLIATTNCFEPNELTPEEWPYEYNNNRSFLVKLNHSTLRFDVIIT